MPELLITFLGDWRIGTGTGTPGALDDTVRRENGLPVVPAGSVTGIWRDGCERVAAALDSAASDSAASDDTALDDTALDDPGPVAPWAGWVRTLFGSQPATDRRHAHTPVPAALAVRTATLPAPVAAALRADPRLARCLHTVRPGVAIDPSTGQATTDYLRALEVTRGGLDLHAPLELDDVDWTEQQQITAWTLLHLGAREVQALGGDRRRGLGRCELTVPDPTGAVAGALVGSKPPQPAALPTGAATAGHCTVVLRDDGWMVLDLCVTCVDPVLSALVATANTVRGQPSVPGGRVLPVVVQRARAAGLDVEHLVRAGDLRCEPLVPEVDGKSGRPLPRAFVAPKGAPVRRVWNLLRTPPPPDATSKPPRNRWVGVPCEGT
ncbi:MAG: RAMP superfamily CRISPR-associated protein, partial [Actinomycetes bacterium]